VVGLRKNVFDVEVYEDAIIRLAQQEADMVKQMSERAQQDDSVTKRRLKEYEELIQGEERSSMMPGS
jgi:hypothetical protein